MSLQVNELNRDVPYLSVGSRGVLGALTPTNVTRSLRSLWLIVLSLSAFIVFLPLLIILLLIVAKDGHHPVAVTKRKRHDGRSSPEWSLRTTTPNSFAGSTHTAPPLNKTGAVLLASSLDRLPQLFNIYRGS